MILYVAIWECPGGALLEGGLMSKKNTGLQYSFLHEISDNLWSAVNLFTQYLVWLLLS